MSPRSASVRGVLTWDDLRGRSLARQLPPATASATAERDVDDVVATLHAIGPVQSQTARSPYVALAARLPGVTREAVTAAYDAHLVVRGSNIRGTVHTTTPQDHALLEVATRVAQRRLYDRTWRLRERTAEEVWSAVEEHARHEWRTAQEIHDHLRAWLDAHDPGHEARLDDTTGRSMSHGHGGLVRRPLSGGWEGQGRAGYLTATTLLGPRDDVLADVEGSLTALVRRHLECHGPSSRHDVAWWSGLGLTVVDAALERLAAELVTQVGPDGRDYHDLPDAPAPVELPGVRLLPEFDATLCAYDSKRRDRFVTPEHFQRLWHQRNALIDAPLMVDGRLTGTWRLTGSGARRRLDVQWFRGTRRPRKEELAEPAAALEAAYGVRLTTVSHGSAG